MVATKCVAKCGMPVRMANRLAAFMTLSDIVRENPLLMVARRDAAFEIESLAVRKNDATREFEIVRDAPIKIASDIVRA